MDPALVQRINDALALERQQIEQLPPTTLPLGRKRPDPCDSKLLFALRAFNALPFVAKLWISNRACDYWRKHPRWRGDDWDYAATMDLLNHNAKTQPDLL
jgi:hypothetical protein